MSASEDSFSAWQGILSTLDELLETPVLDDARSKEFKKCLQQVSEFVRDKASRDSDFFRQGYVDDIKNILKKLLLSAEVFSIEVKPSVELLLTVLGRVQEEDEAIAHLLKNYEDIYKFMETTEPLARQKIFSERFTVCKHAIMSDAIEIKEALSGILQEYALKAKDCSIVHQRFTRIMFVSELIKLQKGESKNKGASTNIDEAVNFLKNWEQFHTLFEKATRGLVLVEPQTSDLLPQAPNEIQSPAHRVKLGSQQEGINTVNIEGEEFERLGKSDDPSDLLPPLCAVGHVQGIVRPKDSNKVPKDVGNPDLSHSDEGTKLNASFGADCLRFAQDHKIAFGIASAVVFTAVFLGVGVIPGGQLIVAAAVIAGAAIASHAGISIGVGVPALTAGGLTFFSNKGLKNTALDEQGLYYLGPF